MTGHKAEAVYRRDALFCEAVLSEGLKKETGQARGDAESKNTALWGGDGLLPQFGHNSRDKAANNAGKYGGGGEI